MSEDVIHAATRSFYNWAGCTIGGSAHAATTTARRALARFSGPPTSHLLGSDNGTDTDASHAALINGIASHMHDYHDTHLDTIIHPTGPVTSALLAMAESLESCVSGAQFITALVAGIEAECKVGLAVWPSHYDVGWHITSTTGAIGAAVSIAKLLALSESRTAHAIGLAATQVTGLREMFGSHAKSFHPGRAAQNGFLAAVLAAEGYTGSMQALEAKRGWASVVSAEHDLDAQMESLGLVGRWEIVRNAFKPFPSGIFVHPVIDGCVWVHGEMERRGLWSDAIQSVEIDVHPLVVELTGKTTPKDGLEAKFSVYHGGCGRPGIWQGHVGAALRADGCRVIVHVRETDESSIAMVKCIGHAVGSLEQPMQVADDQLVDKFLDECIPGRVEDITEVILGTPPGHNYISPDKVPTERKLRGKLHLLRPGSNQNAWLEALDQVSNV
ncbi:hypothetical protein N7492_000655 [Penicillium capsulatum]|uniref:MmgE/PrpD family protein n=1 Tax=Penicillium capsulatum TaxID=69766 RepID=A0A9W9LZL5_9EURO|nr:hypothetical protein N7492_000655 [Penicillium capsulatum]